MKLDIKPILDTTNKVYLPYYNNKSRYFVLYGGAGSGKSRWAGQKVLLRILTEKRHRFLIVRKVAATLSKSVFKLMQDYISKYGLSKYFKINKSEKIITCLLNGNEMYFMGLDDVEKLKSIEGISSIWIEEASEITKDDFTQLDLRLRGYSYSYQQIMLTFNPISQKIWLKPHFFDNDIEDCTIVKTTYIDNQFIDERYKQVLLSLKRTNENFYNIYCLGNWGVLKGRILNPYIEIDRIPIEATKHRVYGADFGTANPSAIIDIYYNKDTNSLYLDEIIYEAGLTRTQLIKKLKDNYPEFLGVLGYGDSAEPSTIKEFKQHGFKMLPAVKDTIMGIDFLNRCTVYITRRSKNLKEEWDNYKWKEDKDGNLIEVPIKDNDHAIDAVRYGAYSEWGVIRVVGKGIVDKRKYEMKKQLSFITNEGKKYGGY